MQFLFGLLKSCQDGNCLEHHIMTCKIIQLIITQMKIYSQLLIFLKPLKNERMNESCRHVHCVHYNSLLSSCLVPVHKNKKINTYIMFLSPKKLSWWYVRNHVIYLNVWNIVINIVVILICTCMCIPLNKTIPRHNCNYMHDLSLMSGDLTVDEQV